MYSNESVEWLFESADADPREERILQALQMASPNNLSRNDVRAGVFSNHISALELNTLRHKLVQRKAVRVTEDETGGRPVETWVLAHGT